MEAFLELFGTVEILGFTLNELAVVLAAGTFLYVKVYKKTWIPWYENQKKKDEMIHVAFDEVKKYEDHRIHDREQSFAIQKQLTNTMAQLSAAQDDIVRRLDEMSESDRKYKLADIRGSLLESYRYYTSIKTNPSQAWTEMEAHSFWEQFDEYTRLKGNGFMKDTVQPAMAKLDVISLSNIEMIASLMESRNTCK